MSEEEDDDDDDDFDLSFEEMCAMTEEQADALLARQLKELAEREARWAARTPIIEQYRYYRKRRLELIMQWRRLLKKMPMGEFGIKQLKDRQISLLKIRMFKETGVWPRSDG